MTQFIILITLQGERKGQENLKNDLVRRIKMLEYALKQERAKYAKLKAGSTAPEAASEAAAKGQQSDDDDMLLPPPADASQPPHAGDNFVPVSNVNWRQGRQLLRQYLQEIGYTDTIIDVRSNRVRSLLGLNDNGSSQDQINEQEQQQQPNVNGAMARKAQQQQQQQQQQQSSSKLAEEMVIDSEAAVMANFDFLSSEAEVDDDDDDGDEYSAELKMKAAAKLAAVAAASSSAVDKETEDVLNEFNFLTNPEDKAESKGKKIF